MSDNSDSEQEAQWRKQFEAAGRDEVLFLCNEGIYSGPLRGFAFRWLKERDDAREGRGKDADWYTKWTFRAAVAAVIVGVVGIVVTWLQ
jgi:hypothetical protein